MFKIVRTGTEPKPAKPARRRTSKQKEARDALMVTWLTLGLCALVSVAFNVRGTAMHTFEPLALGSSAIWPAVAVLGVHVAARGTWGTGAWWSLARYGIVGGGALASMVTSMSHTRAVLTMYGADSASAIAGPLVLDAVMVTCGLSLVNARKPATGGKGRQSTARKPARRRATAPAVTPVSAPAAQLAAA